MKPIIGICTNYSNMDQPGLSTKLGLPGQEWQMVADDYVKGVERGGGIPIIIPIMQAIENVLPVLECLDGIVFTGGQDIDPHCYGKEPHAALGAISPERDGQEIALAKRVLNEMDIPILGICRGHQVLNVAAGGTLYADIESQLPEAMAHSCFHAPKYHRVHRAEVCPGTKLHEIFKCDSMGINSFHHQAIERIGAGFEVAMTAGDGVIEAMEFPGNRFVVSVQWHPEMMIDRHPEYIALFKSFVDSCFNKGKREISAV